MFKDILKQVNYWYFNKPVSWLKMRVFYLKRAQRNLYVEYTPKKDEKIDLIIVAFNNEKIIELQKDRLEKYFKDPYDLIIVDNSSDDKKSLVIFNLCLRNNIAYVKLPKQNNFKLSDSHGIALNWVYRNLIKKRKPKYFGFLDHDVFPIKPVRIKSFLEKQNFYGLKHYAITKLNLNIWDDNSPHYWYLWPGFSFFKFHAIKNIKRVNFMPLHSPEAFFDTGGGNWLSIYSIANRLEIIFPVWKREQCGDGDIIDLIDDKWVHTMNGSDWRGLNKRASFIEEVLFEFEHKVK